MPTEPHRNITRCIGLTLALLYLGVSKADATYTFAQPLGTNSIVLGGSGGSVSVTLNGKSIAISNTTVTSATNNANEVVTYIQLAQSLTAGTLIVKADGSNFTYSIPSSPISLSVGNQVTHTISDFVYGVNWPSDGPYIKEQGTPISRWGGNAVTAYNPNGDFTNAGNDWYFENRNNENADEWSGWIKGNGSQVFLTVPALDWVSKDSTSYSYPRSVFPNQQQFDPYNSNAGDGLDSNGNYYNATPSTTYISWTNANQTTWLKSLKNTPAIIAVDNEIEIASSTHADMHHASLGYDEIVSRVVNTSKAAKAALPKVAVAAPSVCAWWFYWTSAVGASDKSSHNGMDYLPYFLEFMANASASANRRLLDYLDIHYYPDGVSNSNVDSATQGHRLRSTRSLWDSSYIDESWIGTSTPYNSQPNANAVMLIPRMRALIEKYYPNTKLFISEYDFGGQQDISGGLAFTDALGIFGREGLDGATMWSDPDKDSAAGVAFWMYKGGSKAFGNKCLSVSGGKANPDSFGAYAAHDSRNKTSIVLVNKNNSTDLTFNITGLPSGNYVMKHFGGSAGIFKYQTTVKYNTTGVVIVPAYSAIFLSQ